MTSNKQTKLVRIAVDAMGGDFAPKEVVQGAIEAASSKDVQVILVGDPKAVQFELSKHNVSGLPIAVIPSEGVIMEGEPPAQALRQKPKASILVCHGLVKMGHADAVVTMGSTGAAMAASVITFGTMEGIERPALGGPILGLAPKAVLIDLGTNVDCKPAQLLSFGIIGSVFARLILSVENPRVALLSVGAEEGKGNRQVKDTTLIFKHSGLNFIGNVEGHDIPLQKADVVVCDGFVGNVLMKYTEGVGEAFAAYVKQKVAGKLSDAEANKLHQQIFDLTNLVENVGGGPLFGVKGVSVVGHGRSKAGAIQRAIKTAKLAVEINFIQAQEAELKKAMSKLGGQS